MRSIAHRDHGKKPERMKFLRIIFGCPEGARKWRIFYFAMLLHSKKRSNPIFNHIIPDRFSKHTVPKYSIAEIFSKKPSPRQTPMALS